VKSDDGVYEVVWRTAGAKVYVGLRVGLAKVSLQRVQELVQNAWRNKAPKRLVAEHDTR
jgi:hypothetical protein